jgi:hypothetical protein
LCGFPQKARGYSTVCGETVAVQRDHDQEMKHDSIFRTHMCVLRGGPVTEKKILISTKRSLLGRHLAYVIRIALRPPVATVPSPARSIAHPDAAQS